MNESLNTTMDSSDINEDWVRKHYNLAKERKTMTISVIGTVEIDDQAFNYKRVKYCQFFDILKTIVDVNILNLIVKHNITCAEKDINVELELSTNDWYGESENTINIYLSWKYKETNIDVVKRLITKNRRSLTALKRKEKKHNAMAEKIKKMSEKERQELRELL